MSFSSKVASVLGYRVLPTSILAFVTYLSILLALAITDVLPNVPAAKDQGGLNLEEAYEDLRHIAARPHPYNSHANDDVRNYLLSRLSPLVKEFRHVHISDDIVSNGSWSGPAYGTYFEGTNILVKIDGRNSTGDKNGILFSAHYDSVSTASGATDDGMGVATVLQLVQYFAEHQPKRTAIFNINNGEEDWLNGAHAFLQHPWSALTDTFLNLEGAAAGGRPILFRATSTSPVRAFHNTKLVPHPHANVLSSDAFARGLIRSGTDFSVYTGPGSHGGMEGLDLAFYKGRSRYHTKYDAVQHTLGGKKSLWSMMETAKGVGIGLLEGGEHSKEGGPVYFDLFKSVLVVFPLSGLLTFNIVTLVVGPIVLILLLVFERVLFASQNNSAAGNGEDDVGSSAQTPQQHSTNLPGFHRGSSWNQEHDTEDRQITTQGNVSWLHTIWRHGKFWVSLVATIGMQILLMWIYVAVNPFAIYSSPYIVLSSLLSLAYLSFMFIITLPSSLPFYNPKGQPTPNHFILPPAQQLKHTLFFHLYTFTWILLVLSTLGITKVHPGIGGGYVISAWNTCVALACLICAVESFIGSKSDMSNDNAGYDEVLNGEEELEGEVHVHQSHGVANERTPLITRVSEEDLPASAREHRRHLHSRRFDGGGVSTWWWIPQFVISVPVPVILLGQIAMLLLDGMTQSLADGASAWSVYTLTSLPAVLMVMPLVPFAYKLRPCRPLSLFVLAVFTLSTLYALLIFPFSIETPLKVYFQQRVEFSPTLVEPKVITSLIGPGRYIKTLVASLPSSLRGNNQGPVCADDKAKIGLTNCEWASGANMVPDPGSREYYPYPEEKRTAVATPEAAEKAVRQSRFFYGINATRTGTTSAMITVQGKNTRSCRLYFDAPIFGYTVRRITEFPRGPSAEMKKAEYQTDDQGLLHNFPKNSGMQEGYEVGPKGIKEVRFWTRTWDKQLKVDVTWRSREEPSSDADNNSTKPMHGRIACEWAEYQSAMIDVGSDVLDGSISAYNESQIKTTTARLQPKIPALEETLAFLPHWSTISKAADGLVEAWVPFVI